MNVGKIRSPLRSLIVFIISNIFLIYSHDSNFLAISKQLEKVQMKTSKSNNVFYSLKLCYIYMINRAIFGYKSYFLFC